jgi:hypothetical protein
MFAMSLVIRRRFLSTMAFHVGPQGGRLARESVKGDKVWLLRSRRAINYSELFISSSC